MGIRTFATAVALGVLTWASVAQAADKGTIGISMPTKSSARWIADGNNMVKSLEAMGYKADLQYAERDRGRERPDTHALPPVEKPRPSPP